MGSPPPPLNKIKIRHMPQHLRRLRVSYLSDGEFQFRTAVALLFLICERATIVREYVNSLHKWGIIILSDKRSNLAGLRLMSELLLMLKSVAPMMAK